MKQVAAKVSRFFVILFVIWLLGSCVTINNINPNTKMPVWNFWNVAQIIREAK